ncbi:uncharacterized protein znf106b [Garra rufa]|uniref:uncharacterized protein znf106b n=1 Tax=Garra rufa TaxID=137080 RepID=UPI003CCE82D1
MGLEQYKEHITTRRHNHNMFSLSAKRKKGKPLQVDYNIDLNESNAVYDLRKQDRSQNNLDQYANRFHHVPEKEWDKHMHGFVHHQATEQLKGSEPEHKCWACEMSVMGMAAFRKHIGTQDHIMKLSELEKNRKLGKITVDYSLEFAKLKDLCAQRDREKSQKNLDQCTICCHRFPEKEWDKHMHSIVHHQAIEQLKGSGQNHKCWACEMSVTGMAAFKQHIGTQYHKIKLSELEKNKKRGKITVDYSVEFDELKDLCAQRDRERRRKKNLDQCTICFERFPKKEWDKHMHSISHHQAIEKLKGRSKTNLDKCTICFHRFPEKEWDKHMHGIVHHQAIEQLKGSQHEHKCWACDMSTKGMAAFKNHIGTQDHKRKLQELMKNREHGKNTMDYSVEFNELKDLCAKRDQKKHMKKNKWIETYWDNTRRFTQTKSTAENGHNTIPIIANEGFTDDQLQPSCHSSSFEKNPNNHPASIQQNQNLPTQRDDSIIDMDTSNEPLMKRRCLERPSENILQEMFAHGAHPKPDGKGTDVCMKDVTPETEDGTAAEPICDLRLVQSRMEAKIPNSTTASGVCLTRKAATGNEAVVLNPPLQEHTCSKRSVLKVNKAASQSEQGMTSEGTSGQEPLVDSLPPVSLLAEMFESQTSGNDLEIIENVHPHTVCVLKNKPIECDTEQAVSHSSSEAISSNVQKTKEKIQDVSQSPKTNKISRKRKVNTLLSLSLKEEELTSSLENVGEQLFQAYSTMQNAYTEVQRLLAVKKEVTSEMASLRAKRIEILQEMKSPDDQQEVLNAS